MTHPVLPLQGGYASSHDRYNVGGPAGLQLWIRGPGIEAPIPSDWFTMSPGAMPQGWSFSADGVGASYSRAIPSQNSVVLVSGDGSTQEFKAANPNDQRSGFVPPAGVATTLSLKADGTYIAQSEDGYDYEFDAAGSVVNIQSSSDDKNLAAPRHVYESNDGASRVKAIQDPVRSLGQPTPTQIEIKYSSGVNGGSPCETAPNGFAAQAPVGMICRIDYWDGKQTFFYYTSGGLLARIVDPDSQVTDFGYDASIRLSSVRNSVQNDWLAQPGHGTADAARTDIAYDGLGRATQVTLASSNGLSTGPARPFHKYNYVSPNEATVEVGGITPSGSQAWVRKFQWDNAGRTTLATDANGATTQNAWNPNDQLLSTISDARQIGQSLPTANLAKQSTTFYDVDGRVIETFGPAPSYCFGVDRRPNGTCTNPSMPHTTTTYDGNFTGGNNGLAAAYWTSPTVNDSDFTGGAKFHAYINGSNGNAASGGSWAYPAPAALNNPVRWSVKLTGRIQLASMGEYRFIGAQNQRIFVDDKLVYDSWQSSTPTYQVPFNNATANSSHRFRVDFSSGYGTAPGLLWTTPLNGSQTVVPGSVLTPNYGLATQTISDDGTAGSPSTVTKTSYADPAYGLVTAVTNDPSGQNLMTQTAYEPLGTGYFRKTSTTLPAGNGWTYTYYGATESVSACGGSAISQGGLMKARTSPGGAVVENFVYDAAGRAISSWRNGDTQPSCSSYDARGRVASVTMPQFSGSTTIDTTTYNYKVNNDVLQTSVTNNAGPIKTITDLLGQVVSYTDAWQRTTTFAYDQAGRQTSSTGDSDARSIQFDSYGRPLAQLMGSTQGAALPLATASYDVAGNMNRVDYNGGNGNGTSVDIAQDIYGHMSSLTYKRGATTLATNSVTYSQQGRMMTDAVTGSPTSTFSYDGAGRLSTASVNSNTYSYGFAPSGGCGTNTAAGKNTNRTSFQLNSGTPQTYCYDNADRLTSTTAPGATGTISYDSHGNTVTIGGSTMTYDGFDNHLTTTSGDETATYVRDALGRVVQRSTTGVPALRSKTTAATNGATSLTINTPANVQPNDVLLAHVVVNAGNTATITAPAGWTQMTNRSNDPNVRSVIFWHVAMAGESTTKTFTFNGTYQAAGGIVSYTGVDTATPIDDWNSNSSSGTATSWNSDAAYASHANDREVVFLAARQSTDATPGSRQIEQWDVASSGSTAGTRAQSQMSDKSVTASGWYTGSGTLATAAHWVSQQVLLNPKSSTIRYGYADSSDSPNVTMDTSNNVVDKTVQLFGGVSRSIHYDTNGNANPTWQYPNIHGDILFQADQSGNKTTSNFLYDPYGQPLAGHPDDLTGNFDYGWLGSKQRGTELEGSLNIIEMGARQYSPLLGRFLQTDPIEMGSANNYEYVNGDPINRLDLEGTTSKKNCEDLWKKLIYEEERLLQRIKEYNADVYSESYEKHRNHYRSIIERNARYTKALDKWNNSGCGGGCWAAVRLPAPPVKPAGASSKKRKGNTLQSVGGAIAGLGALGVGAYNVFRNTPFSVNPLTGAYA